MYSSHAQGEKKLIKIYDTVKKKYINNGDHNLINI